MHNALDVGPRSIDGRVQHEASLVHPQIGAASVHNLPLQVDLDLGRSYRDTRKLTGDTTD